MFHHFLFPDFLVHDAVFLAKINILLWNPSNRTYPRYVTLLCHCVPYSRYNTLLCRYVPYSHSHYCVIVYPTLTMMSSLSILLYCVIVYPTKHILHYTTPTQHSLTHAVLHKTLHRHTFTAYFCISLTPTYIRTIPHILL